MAYEYSYLIADVALLLVWMIFFFRREAPRKEMIILSLIFGVCGILSEFVYARDWWHPLTITGSIVGFEDFLFGFVFGGIASVAFTELFNKKIEFRRADVNSRVWQFKNFLYVLASLIVLFFGSFFILRINSFYSTIIAVALPLSYILYKRNDLVVDSLISGALMLALALILFPVIEIITPGWVAYSWYVDNLSGIMILRAPIDDLLWFFIVGAFIGPLYEFWREGRVTNS